MERAEAARMILAESAGLPELGRIAREVHAGAARGQAELRVLVREAGLAGVLDEVRRKHGTGVAGDVILGLEPRV